MSTRAFYPKGSVFVSGASKIAHGMGCLGGIYLILVGFEHGKLRAISCWKLSFAVFIPEAYVRG